LSYGQLQKLHIVALAFQGHGDKEYCFKDSHYSSKREGENIPKILHLWNSLTWTNSGKMVDLI